MTQEIIAADSSQNTERDYVKALYIVHGLCLVFSMGTLSIIPLIFNYIKRGDTAGTYLSSHHSWMIRSYWWFALWAVVAVLCAITVIGIPLAFLVIGAAWIWKAYRLIRGFIDLDHARAMPM